jgi:hypothetical protein
VVSTCKKTHDKDKKKIKKIKKMDSHFLGKLNPMPNHIATYNERAGHAVLGIKHVAVPSAIASLAATGNPEHALLMQQYGYSGDRDNGDMDLDSGDMDACHSSCGIFDQGSLGGDFSNYQYQECMDKCRK